MWMIVLTLGMQGDTNFLQERLGHRGYKKMIEENTVA